MIFEIYFCMNFYNSINEIKFNEIFFKINKTIIFFNNIIKTFCVNNFEIFVINFIINFLNSINNINENYIINNVKKRIKIYSNYI